MRPFPLGIAWTQKNATADLVESVRHEAVHRTRYGSLASTPQLPPTAKERSEALVKCREAILSIDQLTCQELLTFVAARRRLAPGRVRAVLQSHSRAAASASSLIARLCTASACSMPGQPRHPCGWPMLQVRARRASHPVTGQRARHRLPARRSCVRPPLQQPPSHGPTAFGPVSSACRALPAL